MPLAPGVVHRRGSQTLPTKTEEMSVEELRSPRPSSVPLDSGTAFTQSDLRAESVNEIDLEAGVSYPTSEAEKDRVKIITPETIGGDLSSGDGGGAKRSFWSLPSTGHPLAPDDPSLLPPPRGPKAGLQAGLEPQEGGTDGPHDDKQALRQLWRRQSMQMMLEGKGHSSVADVVVKAAPTVKEAMINRTSTFFHEDKRSEGPKKAKIYDPKENLKNIFTWHGTAVKLVFYCADFWVLFVGHVLLQFFYYGYQCSYPASDEMPEHCPGLVDDMEPKQWPVIEIGTLLIIASFLTFFVVFFNSQAYNRFFQEYFIACKIRYAVNDAFFLVRLHTDNPKVVFSVFRMMHAAVYLGFTNLSQNKELIAFEDAMHQRLVSMKLLTQRESIRLKSMAHSDPSTECLIWAMRELRDLLEDKKISVPIYRAIEGNMMKIRLQFDEMRSYNEQPVPFVYYHLVNVIVELYLVVVCYAATFVTPFYSIVGYLGTLVGLLGLREAAACLADPLGLDETDIPVFAMATETHFEQLYVVTRMDVRAPGAGFDADIPALTGLGSLENMAEVAEGVHMGDFTTEEKDVNPIHRQMITPRGVLSAQGPHKGFWETIQGCGIPTKDSKKREADDAPKFDVQESDEEWEEEFQDSTSSAPTADAV